MTIVTLLVVGLIMPVAAAAQDWQAYSYPDLGFTIQFPSMPAVETSKVRNAAGVSLPMTRYAVRQDRIIFTLSIVNYSSTNADSLSTIAETARSLGASGKVTAAASVRVNGALGRELSIDGTDGSRSAIAIFFANGHLYTLVGQALPPNAIEKSGDAIRFRESLQFLGDEEGFGRFFHRAGADHSKRADHPQADAACAGKSAGDAVQLETPGGPVPAICTLVARPTAGLSE